jgi:alpha-N-acetylglucosaminidase
MQGWLFGADKHFWDPPAVAAYLSQVPDDKLMVLDIGNDRYPDVWKNAKAFGGKPWIYGYVHNYGGSNPVYGDLDYYRRDLTAIDRAASTQASWRVSGCSRRACTAIRSSTKRSTTRPGIAAQGSQSAWLSTYARGALRPHDARELDAALGQLVEAAYSTRYWSLALVEEQGGGLSVLQAADGRRSSTSRVIRAIGANWTRPSAPWPARATRSPTSPLFVLDLVDAARHLASLEIDGQLQAAVAAYRRGEVAAGDRARGEVEALALAVDALLGVQPESLATWIDDAKAYGDTPANAAAYVANAKAQVTVWGGEGNLNDYASKAWQGLYRDFYLPRWSRFLDALKAAGTGPFDEAAVTRDGVAWERAWVSADTVYRRQRPADPVGGVKALIAHLDQARKTNA